MELWKHQVEIINRAKNTTSFAIFADAGTGKTRTLIEILRARCQEAGRLLSTIIFCPPIVIENWRREILQFSKIPPNNITKLTGSQVQRVKAFKDKSREPHIFITNYEALLMRDLYAEMTFYNPEVLVFDESHKIKSPEAKRTKAAIDLSDRAKFKYALSGTPVLNDLLDIWSQFRVLDGGESFGKKFFVFRQQYFYNRNASNPHVQFPDWRVRPNADSLITDLMQAKSMSVKKEDCMDLPPFVRQKVYVEMGSEQKKAYTEMKKNFITWLKAHPSSADLAITKALRLQQIVSGFMKLDPSAEMPEGKIVRFEENPRIDALKELLTELAPYHKVLVWACFKENYAMIREVCESLSLEYIELHGEIAQKKRDESAVRFREDEKIRVVIGNQAACGLGINLVEASYSIYFSRNFSLEQDIQSEARNYRGGSECHLKITRIDLVTPETIDEEVLSALASKQAISEQVLREIAGRISCE